MTGPNRDALIRVARALGPLCGDLVFAGGQVAELLVTDPGSVRVRPTDDVDVICEAGTLSAYDRLSSQLRARGFFEDRSPGAPICRWRVGTDVLDVMPASGEVLGFSNAWFTYGIRTAMRHSLERGLEIRILSAPAFLAAKWEAFAERGADDLHRSDDVEDIITVVAGRPEIVSEIAGSEPEVRAYLVAQTRRFMDTGATPDVIAGALPDARIVSGLIGDVEDRFLEIASLE